MKPLLTTLLLATLCATGYGQTIKTLGYNTNGQVVYAGTNVLTFTNNIRFGASGIDIQADGTLFFFDADGSKDFFVFDNGAGGADQARARTNLALGWPALTNTNAATSLLGLDVSNQVVAATNIIFTNGVAFTTNAAAATLANLGLGTNASVTISNLNAQSVNISNVTNFRTAIGLGATNSVAFNSVTLGTNGALTVGIDGPNSVAYNFNNGGIEIEGDRTNSIITFIGTNLPAIVRKDIGLGATNNVAFRNITSDGNIIISNQSATNDGLLFIYRTNNEPFLGLANLIASNNTTISNETLFRVGVAEATNKAAQFGFRSTNTNGSGVAVFSVFGYNALMMIGADASTNAVVYSGGGTNNEVMTLIRDGATEFARPIRFSTNASTRPSTNAPVNTTNVAAWIEFRIGTNSYRAPLYQ
jgi:hypothetical protein